MALNRRSGQRFEAAIWPGFVDAMTALLLVLIFVLTIFMVVQSVQNDTITGQETELDLMTDQIDDLSDTLGAEQVRSATLEEQLSEMGLDLDDAQAEAERRASRIASLSQQVSESDAALSEANAQITAYEAQVATLLSDRQAARDRVATLEGALSEETDNRDALETALALARSEVDAEAEAARLAAARREALEALVADLSSDIDEKAAALEQTRTALSEEEAARVADAAAAEALREKLKSADAELSAMTLSLEQQRQKAEDTLTLLAAARKSSEDLDARLMAALLEEENSQQALDAARDRLAAQTEAQQALREQLADALLARETAQKDATEAQSEADRQARLLALANDELSDAEATTADDRRRLALLNEQIGDMRGQLGRLQTILSNERADDAAAEEEIAQLGTRLNIALARVAEEQKARAELEAAERARLEDETKKLENYRSEFFGRLRQVVGDQEGVKIVGDRFVFSSEVLFDSGSADLSAEGRSEIAKVARLLQEVAALIPPEIDWVIRVDGHTDDRPITGGGQFRDNWELSSARALSVVRFMVDQFGFPADRLAATGFAEFQPLDPADTEAARARNRRIELKLTER